ncbi:MAG TPA: DUF2027 domain-containing protein [Bacteroidales bacterium]
MTFKVGDKVKFLNDVGGGIITRIKQQTAFIETSDGFEIPADFSELIKVEETGFGGMRPEPTASVSKFAGSNVSVQKNSPQRQEIEELEHEMEQDDSDEEVITSENCTLNILLGLVPVKMKGSMEPDFQVYLISDCAYRMLYTFSVVQDNFVRGRKVGHVEEDTKVLVTTFTMVELKQIQSFKINCIFYKKGIYLPHEPVIYEYRVDPLSIVAPATWEENDYFEEKAIVVNITEMSLLYEIERMVTETEEKFIIQKKRKDQTPKKTAAKPQPSAESETEEVDLHIEHLVDDYSSLSAGEIVDIQMSRFTIAMEGAIRGKTRKIVFIHGVGNGKLKYEIRKTLDSKYPKLRYQDASFKEYGYGATMVMVK